MASAAEEQLRRALAAGDFEEAQRLLPPYSKEVVTCLARPSTKQEHQQALQSFHDLLSLARIMRAHISAQLAKLQHQSCYRYHNSGSEKHSWHFDG